MTTNVNPIVVAASTPAEKPAEPNLSIEVACVNATPLRKPSLPYFHQTDSGNAELLAYLFGKILRFDHQQGRWLIWNETRKRWAVDKQLRIRSFATQAAKARLLDAANLVGGGEEQEARRRKEINWALQSESRYGLDAALELAKSLPPISNSGREWDKDPFLLGVANGVVDLRTGTLREERQQDYITKHSPVAFDPDAKCPLFEKFLTAIFPENPAMMSRYMQKAMGYTLTGDVREQRSFFNYGDGSNGKGTLFETMRFILGEGEYAVNLPFSALEHSKYGNSATNELVKLFGARFATSSETGDGVRLNEARLKALTGGDAITARELYQKSFTFSPTHKLWLAFNHKPVVNDDSYGFWRRIDLIGYNKKFEGKEKDDQLRDKLREEASGILAFAVRGCLLWQKEGLERPPDVEAATAAYQEESDVVGRFISECCVLEPGAVTLSSDLWRVYRAWEENEERHLARKAFTDRLEKRGLKSGKHKGQRAWFGIRLQDENNEAPPTLTATGSDLIGSLYEAGDVEVGAG